MSLLKTSSKIRIIGGGIGGLAVALSLRRHGFSNVHVYEKDESFDSRRQGYALTINASSTPYLTELGILDEVRRHNLPSHSHMSFDARNGDVIGYFGSFLHPEIRSRNSFNMHLSRQAFRNVLYRAIHSNDETRALGSQGNEIVPTVIWNKRLRSLRFDEESTESNEKIDAVPLRENLKTLSVYFADGSKEEGIELLVGADGIYSTVKEMILPGTKLNYLGVLIILGL